MRILLIGLNYLPESTSIGPYTADLAEYLCARGHQVRVVTGFPMAPQWRVWDGYRGRLFQRETINGVSVLRTWLYVPQNPRRALCAVREVMRGAQRPRLGVDLPHLLRARIGADDHDHRPVFASRVFATRPFHTPQQA